MRLNMDVSLQAALFVPDRLAVTASCRHLLPCVRDAPSGPVSLPDLDDRLRAVKPPRRRIFPAADAASSRNKILRRGGAPLCFARFAVQTRRPPSL